MRPRQHILALALALAVGASHAETIRIAIGTQDHTINCATGGLLIRELKLLEKYLPHGGKYQDAQYSIEWKDYASGAPIGNDMLAGKLDIGSMADFPGAFNGAAFRKTGRQSLFITVLSGSILGSGNGIVVPKNSRAQSLADLKGKTISVPYASTAHGMLLRAIRAEGWDPDRDVTIVPRSHEQAGAALQKNKIDAHADFVPFAELFPHRGIARKIFDGSQATAPTFHGSMVDAQYAKKYPEIVIAFLRAALEANRLMSAEPEKYSELIAKVSGIEAEVNYLFHGPLGVQTRDLSWKPEYRQAVKTAIDTLRQMKRTEVDLDAAALVDDTFVRAAFRQARLDYEAALKNYAKSPLTRKDAGTGKAITDVTRVAQIWVEGEPLVRHYATLEGAFAALRRLENGGQKIRVVYAHDRNHGLKLLAADAWFVRAGGQTSAFLLKQSAAAYAAKHGGKVQDYDAARNEF